MKKNSNQLKYSVGPELALVLLDIRSVQNVASLFRTADCAGVSKIYLVGTTPAPVDRFKRVRDDFAKISLGSELTISYEYFSSAAELLNKLRDEKYQVVALEQSETATDYKDFKMKGKSALILGNEVSGVSEDVLRECDDVILIPMQGSKESLNVSVAGAIAIFRILNI